MSAKTNRDGEFFLAPIPLGPSDSLEVTTDAHGDVQFQGLNLGPGGQYFVGAQPVDVDVPNHIKICRDLPNRIQLAKGLAV